MNLSREAISRRTVEMLLAGNHAGLRRQADALTKEVRHQLGNVCPECGSSDCADNGKTEYACCACEHRWGFDGDERYGF